MFVFSLKVLRRFVGIGDSLLFLHQCYKLGVIFFFILVIMLVYCMHKYTNTHIHILDSFRNDAVHFICSSSSSVSLSMT